jgi:hypothetical protein
MEMRFTKLLFKNIAWILGVLAALVAGLFAVQGDAMSNLLLVNCSRGDIWCVIKIDALVLTAVFGVLFLVIFAPPVVTDSIISVFKFTLSLLVKFFKTPNFSNVEISFSETKTGDISICAKNKEWRYPSVSIEALSEGNLKWEPFQKSDIAEIEKRGSKYATFLKSANDEFYIDSKNDQFEKLPIGKHRINIVFYIAFEKIRIARTYILDVVYKGKNNISIVDVVQLKDMPQSNEAWSIYEKKNNLITR